MTPSDHHGMATGTTHLGADPEASAMNEVSPSPNTTNLVLAKTGANGPKFSHFAPASAKFL